MTIKDFYNKHKSNSTKEKEDTIIRDIEDNDKDYSSILIKIKPQISQALTCLKSEVPKIIKTKDKIISYIQKPSIISETNNGYIVNILYIDIYKIADLFDVDAEEDGPDYVDKLCDKIIKQVNPKLHEKYPNLSLKQNTDMDWDSNYIDLIIKGK